MSRGIIEERKKSEKVSVVSKTEYVELKRHYYETEEVRDKGLTKVIFEFSNPDLVVVLKNQHIKLYDRKRVEGAVEVLRKLEEKNLIKINLQERYSEFDRTKLYYTKTTLKKRGWTDNLINDFLILPDTTRPNFHHFSRHRIKFYLINRVHFIEELEEFVQYTKKKFGMSLKERRTEAQHIDKAQELELDAKAKVENLKKVRKWKPKIEQTNLSYDELKKIAYESYEELPDYIKYINGKITVVEESDEEFFDRILLNYIRNYLTDYDRFINVLRRGKTVKIEVNEKLGKEIVKYYPFLADACKRRIEYISN